MLAAAVPTLLLLISSPATQTRNLFRFAPYFDWIRSPNPFKVYPRIFAELTQGPAKRSAASHSVSWGKRAQDTGDNAKTKRFPLKLSQRQLQHWQQPGMCGTEEENVEKRIWREDAGEAARTGGGAKQDPVRDLVYRRNLLDAFYAIRYYPVVKFGKTPFYSLIPGARNPAGKIMRMEMTRIRKRRVGMIQTAQMLPSLQDECQYLDSISKQICYFLLSLSHRQRLLLRGMCKNTSGGTKKTR